jgi:hypothetical protein
MMSDWNVNKLGMNPIKASNVQDEIGKHCKPYKKWTELRNHEFGEVEIFGENI